MKATIDSLSVCIVLYSLNVSVMILLLFRKIIDTYGNYNYDAYDSKVVIRPIKH